MIDANIQRINFLARKSRTEGLTAQEQEEQQRLRQEYIAAFRASMRAQLDAIELVDGPVPPHKLVLDDPAD